MSWRVDFLHALQHRDDCELASREVYRHYFTLAKLSANPPACNDTPLKSGAQMLSQVKVRERTSPARTAVTSSSRWKDDLAAAQKKRSELDSAFQQANDEIERLHLEAIGNGKCIRELTSENTVLKVKLQDRIEELKGKSKLLQDLHDETVALTLQLNVLEDRNGNLEQENRELIQRWMARVGREADAMNSASKFS